MAASLPSLLVLSRRSKFILLYPRAYVMNKLRHLPTSRVDDVLYCDICTLPPEYCAYRNSLSKCKEWLLSTHPDVFKRLYPTLDESCAEPGSSASLATDSAARAAIKDDSSKLERKLEAAAEKRRKTKITIKSEQRKGKKCVTIITGLDVFDVENKKAAKALAHKYATGTSVGKNAEGKEEIVVQGNFVDTVGDFLLETFSALPASNITRT